MKFTICHAYYFNFFMISSHLIFTGFTYIFLITVSSNHHMPEDMAKEGTAKKEGSAATAAPPY
jgi:hypothetical protein